MKSLKNIVVLTFFALGPNLLLATEMTEYSYGRNDFCKADAKSRMKHLNDLTKPDVDKIEVLKKNINELEARKKIIGDLKTIRNDYLNTIESITSGTAPSSKNTIKIKQVENFKGLLKSAMTLNAISLLMKNKKKSETSPTMNSLCNEPENKDQTICQKYAYSLSSASNVFQISSLNSTLANFSTAMNHVNQADAKTSLENEITQIYDSIPQKIEPQVILEILAKRAPNLAILANTESKIDVEKCLNGINQSCKSLLDKPNASEDLTKLISLEAEDAGHEISLEYKKVQNKINDNSSWKLSQILKTYSNPSEMDDEKDRIFVNNKVKQVLEFSEKLYKKENPNYTPESSVIPNGFSQIGLTEDDYKDFKANCLINKSITGVALNSQLKICDKNVKTLLDKINKVESQIDSDSKNYQSQLDKLLNQNSSLAKLEKLKQFTAQKYMRECPQSDSQNLDFTSNFMGINCQNLATVDSSSTGNLSTLSSSFSNLVGNLKLGNRPTNAKVEDGTTGTFSKSEMAVFAQFCKEKESDKEIVTICKDIQSENNRLAKVRNNKEWDNFNKKYYVQYNRKNPKGYDVIEKRSNASIIGEGLLQNVNRIFPLWINNFQMENQINYLTNQALITKQVNYMNDPTSPWMNSNPYFQTNYFPMFGGFPGFGSPTVPTSGGFNFTK
jgi:hypothetical protein